LHPVQFSPTLFLQPFSLVGLETFFPPCAFFKGLIYPLFLQFFYGAMVVILFCSQFMDSLSLDRSAYVKLDRSFSFAAPSSFSLMGAQLLFSYSSEGGLPPGAVSS